MRDPAIQDQLRRLHGLVTGFPDFTADRGFYADEKTYTGYLQARYALPLSDTNTVDGLVGRRYTHTTRYVAGAALVTPAATAANPAPAPVLTPFSATTTDNDFLPNASARVEFGGGPRARFTYARTIARPAFGDLNPGLSYLISTNSLILPAGSDGNLDLKPQRSGGFDATLEHYFRKSSFVAIGGYYKNIKDRVISRSRVDATVGYELSRGITVTLNGTNLTRSGYCSFYGDPALPRDQRFDDSTYSIGITAKF